jgi:hypothetical protein
MHEAWLRGRRPRKKEVSGRPFRETIIFVIRYFPRVFILAVMLSGCPAQTDPRLDEDPITWGDSLAGSRWSWSDWGGTVLDFVSGTEVSNGTDRYAYTYNKNTREGRIDYYGPFIISADGLTMTFSNIKNYGHSAEFTLIP